MRFERSKFVRPVLAVLGVLLCSAASLKLYGANVSPVPRTGWMSAPHVEKWVVAYELVLGLWLISGTASTSGWLAAAVTFVTFAGVSAFSGITGVADCGCFGAIKASPWVAFGVDVAAVMLLTVASPRATFPDVRRGAITGLKYGACVAVLCVLIVTIVVMWTGSVGAGLARLRGEQLSVVDYLDFGTGRPGESLVASSSVTNWSDRPVLIFGGTSDCSCTTTDDLPVTVPPGGRGEIRVRLTVPGANPGRMTRTVFLRTDCESRKVLTIQVSCRIE